MFALNSDILNRGPHGPRRKEDRGIIDRRSKTRLRDLCDEILASYRAAKGQDIVTAEDREAAQELLRGMGPTGR